MSNRILIVGELIACHYLQTPELTDKITTILKQEGTQALEAYLTPKGYCTSSRSADDEQWTNLCIWSIGQDRPVLEFIVKDLSPVYSRRVISLQHDCFNIIQEFMGTGISEYLGPDFKLHKNRHGGILLTSGGYINHIESNAIRLETLAKVADHLKSIQNGG